ncbi:MAG TPA: PQQ-binding-like beta-propeller repeat protein [Actinophytocola sp.]|nr:PQQ-binding-like beta-propeller repeat protein [Actinophytocola sp.]
MTAYGGIPAPYPPRPAPRVSPAVLVGVSLWRLAIIGCALYGFSDATGWSANFEGLSQQASLATAIVYVGLLLYPAVTGGSRHEPRSPWLRGATAVLLLLVTGTYFGVMGGEFDYLPFEHVYTPLLVLVDWLFVGRNQRDARWWHPLTWIAFPLAYLVYFLSAEVYQYLYPFLDPGGDEFAAMIGGLLAGVVVTGYLLYGLGKLKGSLSGGHQPTPVPQPHPGHGPPGRPAPPGAAWAGPPPAPAWAGPPPGQGRGRRVAVTVAVVVALVVVGGGVWLWTGSGSDEPDMAAAQDWTAGVESVGAAEVAWQATQGEAPEAVPAGHHWVTDEHLVRRLPGRVAAYDLKTGEVAWEFPLDGGLEDRCPSSPEHSKLRVALLLSTEDPSSPGYECGKLTVLDIGTGEEVFTTELPPADSAEVLTTDVPAVFGEKVVIPGKAGARVLDVASGEVVLAPAGSEGPGCRAARVAVFGELLIAQSACTENGETGNRLRAHDANLEVVWEWVVPPAEDGEPLPVHGVLSVDPLVVEVGHSGRDRELMRVDLKSGATVPIEAYDGGKIRGEFLAACDGYFLRACQQGQVVDGKVILTTAPVQVNPADPEAYPGMASTEYRTELVAFDLKTGAEAWRTGMVDGRALHLVPTDDGSVVAFQSANANGARAMLFSVDASDGALTPLLPIGPAAHEDDDLRELLRTGRFGGENEQAVWRDGLFIMFGMIHRTATTGDVETVAFTLPE